MAFKPTYVRRKSSLSLYILCVKLPRFRSRRLMNVYQNICVSAQRKGPSVGIFICKKLRFYKAVQNFLKKYFLGEFAYKYSLLCIH